LLYYWTKTVRNSFFLTQFLRAIIAQMEASSNQIAQNNAKCISVKTPLDPEA
jgi:hypothetical protein